MLNKRFPHVVIHQSDKNPNVRYALVQTLNITMTSISEYDYIYNYSNMKNLFVWFIIIIQ